MSILLSLLIKISFAYTMGNAPFCVSDNYGNLQCWYHSLSSCNDAAKIKNGICVARPK